MDADGKQSCYSLILESAHILRNLLQFSKLFHISFQLVNLKSGIYLIESELRLGSQPPAMNSLKERIMVARMTASITMASTLLEFSFHNW